MRPATASPPSTTGPAYDAAREAMEAAWGTDAVVRRDRRLDPARQRARTWRCPEAEILLLGTTDGYANIHAPNERVLLDEFEKAVLVEAEFFGRFAEAFTTGSSEEDA